jgi:hypothetical protein
MLMNIELAIERLRIYLDLCGITDMATARRALRHKYAAEWLDILQHHGLADGLGFWDVHGAIEQMLQEEP